MDGRGLWTRFQSHFFHDPKTGFALDISRMNFEHDFFQSLEDKVQGAFCSMEELEKGALSARPIPLSPPRFRRLLSGLGSLLRRCIQESSPRQRGNIFVPFF